MQSPFPDWAERTFCKSLVYRCLSSRLTLRHGACRRLRRFAAQKFLRPSMSFTFLPISLFSPPYSPSFIDSIGRGLCHECAWCCGGWRQEEQKRPFLCLLLPSDGAGGALRLPDAVKFSFSRKVHIFTSHCTSPGTGGSEDVAFLNNSG